MYSSFQMKVSSGHPPECTVRYGRGAPRYQGNSLGSATLTTGRSYSRPAAAGRYIDLQCVFARGKYETSSRILPLASRNKNMNDMNIRSIKAVLEKSDVEFAGV